MLGHLRPVLTIRLAWPAVAIERAPANLLWVTVSQQLWVQCRPYNSTAAPVVRRSRTPVLAGLKIIRAYPSHVVRATWRQQPELGAGPSRPILDLCDCQTQQRLYRVVPDEFASYLPFLLFVTNPRDLASGCLQ